jgi:hypothetical protein
MRRWIPLFCLLAVIASAQGKGKGKGHSTNSGTGTSVNISVVFSTGDRDRISRWAVTQQSKGLPPGLQKHGLPPGLEKQLRRNGTLPPGLQKKITPFPADLLVQIAPPPAGCDYMFVGGRAMIVARAGNVIIDVMALF